MDLVPQAPVRVEPPLGTRATGVTADQTSRLWQRSDTAKQDPFPMYRPDQNPSDATQPTHRASGLVTDREGFRPVALPALAAAVLVAASAARQAALKVTARRQATRFQHEDAPLV